MKIKVRLKNHGYIDGVMHEGGDIVIIDAGLFTDTWMQKIETVEEPRKKGGLFKRLTGSL